MMYTDVRNCDIPTKIYDLFQLSLLAIQPAITEPEPGKNTLASAQIFATYPNEKIHHVTAFIDQIVATGLLTLCILAITDKRLNKNISPSFHPLCIGFVVSLLILSFGFNCG